MNSGFFIAGTDTGVGKTWFTVQLMQHLIECGYQVGGMKPISSGAEWEGDRLINEDAQYILENCSESVDYELVNPAVYEPPVAPAIAAEISGQPIDFDSIMQAYDQLYENNDVVVVEGVGGWRVPVDAERQMSELVQSMQLPVILVIGLRLGCMNHALLSAESIQQDGIPIFGWVISELDKDYLLKDESIAMFESALGSPMLAELPHVNAGKPADAVLNIDSARISEFLQRSAPV